MRKTKGEVILRMSRKRIRRNLNPGVVRRGIKLEVIAAKRKESVGERRDKCSSCAQEASEQKKLVRKRNGANR